MHVLHGVAASADGASKGTAQENEPGFSMSMVSVLLLARFSSQILSFGLLEFDKKNRHGIAISAHIQLSRHAIFTLVRDGSTPSPVIVQRFDPFSIFIVSEVWSSCPYLLMPFEFVTVPAFELISK